MKTRPKLEATHQNDVLVPRLMLSFLRIILNGDFLCTRSIRGQLSFSKTVILFLFIQRIEAWWAYLRHSDMDWWINFLKVFFKLSGRSHSCSMQQNMKGVQIVAPFVHAAVAISGRYVPYFLICFLLFFILLPRFRFDIKIMCEFIVCFRRTYVTSVISRITIKCTCMFKNKNRQKAILTGLPKGDFF